MSFRVALTIAALLFESNLYALSSMKVLNKRIIFGSTNNGNNYVPMETKATKESTAEGSDMKSNVLDEAEKMWKASVIDAPITVAEIDAAQKAWGDALVKISDLFIEEGLDEAKSYAKQVLDSAYGYKLGMAVSFKPTLTTGDQTFRSTTEGALAYFVGDNDNYPDDSGFALKEWAEVRSVRSDVLVDAAGKVAISMGNFFFKNRKGDVIKVDKTFGYYKDHEGVLRIILHHSSLPYIPDPSKAAPLEFPPAQPKALNEVVGLLATTVDPLPISLADVEAAQTAWGEALVQISNTYATEGLEAAKALGQGVLDAAYGYKLGTPVLFKPTLTSGDQVFRMSNEGALAYFCGDNASYPNDKGFAIKPWKKVWSERSSVFMHPDGGIAISQGNFFFESTDGSITKVDKTFGYTKDADGTMRIILHHSSLPYTPVKPPHITVAEIDAAQKAWGDALVKISDLYIEKGISAAKVFAKQVLDSAYGYKVGLTVSFKPTLTTGDQTFRSTTEGALAYFVGQNSKYPNDSGFALKEWAEVRSVRSGILVDASGKFAISMGNFFFKNRKGDVIKVDKTFGYYKDHEGVLRIILHHSSLPYIPDPSKAEPLAFPAARSIRSEKVSILPTTVNPMPISLGEVEAAHKAWAEALLKISSTYATEGLEAAKTLGQQVLDAAYGYKLGTPVLFKPTLTSGDQVFRLTNEGALAYFCGDNSNYPNDKGFAIKPWKKVWCNRSSVFMHPDGGIALSQANFYFESMDGSITKVDKTFGYTKDTDGSVRVIVHHSSLPFVPK